MAVNVVYRIHFRKTHRHELPYLLHIVKKDQGQTNMLNGLWAFMMIAGIIYGSFNGNIQAVTEAAFQSAGEAVSLCITMLGIMSFWTGILKLVSGLG